MRVDASECVRVLDAIETRIFDSIRVGMTQAVKVAYRNARDTTLFHDVTGELRGTIDIVDVSPVKKRLIWRAKHGRYLTEGTKGHGPAYASVMRFQIGDRWISARWVKGIERRPFDTNAALAGSQAMSIILTEGAARAVDYP